MPELVACTTPNAILPHLLGTAIESLIRVHNMLEDPPTRDTLNARAPLLVLTCIDDRVDIHAPPGLAFIVRSAGARAAPVAFSLSFPVAVQRIEAIAVVTHDDCAMIDVESHRASFLAGLTEQGWSRSEAEAHFSRDAPRALLEPVAAAIEEAESLRQAYPAVLVAPLLYGLESGLLFQIAED